MLVAASPVLAGLWYLTRPSAVDYLHDRFGGAWSCMMDPPAEGHVGFCEADLGRGTRVGVYATDRGGWKYTVVSGPFPVE